MLVLMGSKASIITLYAITFLLALYVAWPILSAGIPPSEEGKQPEAAGHVFLAILVATAFLLALINCSHGSYPISSCSWRFCSCFQQLTCYYPFLGIFLRFLAPSGSLTHE